MRFVLVLVLTLTACGAPCVREEPVAGLDGGQAACVRATDCPRAASVLVCTSLEDRGVGCVGCVENRCVRFAPEACR
jgi:hypothetical protein